MRAIVVAIHNEGSDYLRVSVDKRLKCRMMATKITADILGWIKKTSGTAINENQYN